MQLIGKLLSTSIVSGNTGFYASDKTQNIHKKANDSVFVLLNKEKNILGDNGHITKFQRN